MYPTMEFESFVWDEDGCAAERTIAGESFQRLIELCFAQADAFSMNSAPWTHATDRRLARALEPYRVRSFETDSWFCYASTYPPCVSTCIGLRKGQKRQSCDTSAICFSMATKMRNFVRSRICASSETASCFSARSPMSGSASPTSCPTNLGRRWENSVHGRTPQTAPLRTFP